MIYKTHVPCEEMDTDDFWRMIGMGGTTGHGEGHGTIVGDVNKEGYLARWYSKKRKRFPGSGTFHGSCEESGEGHGY